MSKVLICPYLTQEIIDKLHLSQAANNFCERLIELGYFNTVILNPPLSVNEKFNIKLIGNYIKPGNWVRLKNKYIKSACSNFSIIKNLVLLGRKNKIWFYNITAQNFIAVFILNILNYKCNVILADFDPDSFFYKKLVKSILLHTKGLISLSKNNISRKHNNATILNGIVSGNQNGVSNTPVLKNNRHIFLLSGMLNEKTGLSLALKTFAANPNYELWLTGSVLDSLTIKNNIGKYENIKYFERLKYDEYIKILDRITNVLSLRNPAFDDNRYNFPSKILDFLIKKKIVISTMKYEGLDDNFYYQCSYSVSSLNKTLAIVKGLDINETYLGNISKQVKHRYGKQAWVKALEMIENRGK